MSFKTISEVRAANKAAGFHFFDPKTLRFFGTRIVSGLYAGRYFITRENHGPFVGRPASECRDRYTLRAAEPSGHVATVGAFCGFDFLKDAREAARNLAREVRK